MEFGARTQRRMLRRAITASVITVVGTVSLVACAPPSPKPTPTATTIFASEEEALAAATDTYAKYSAAFDLESSKGGVSSAGFTEYVTDTYLAELDEIGVIQQNGWHTQGVTTFDTVSLLAFDEVDRVATVSISLCRDVSGVRIVDANGTDVTPQSRLDRFPLQVRFLSAEEDSAHLLISESGSWAGDSFC